MLDETTMAFLGGGNMATAMIRGLLEAGIAPARIRVSDPDEERRKTLKELFGATVFSDNKIAAAKAGVVVLAVKPGVVENVLSEIAPELAPGVLVISIAAGVPLERLWKQLPPKQPLVRVMPNTPALIGAGISAMLPVVGISPEKRALARQVMAAVGDVVEVTDESLMDGVTALSGSGPAFVFLIAEAFSDGGVACGLPRRLADQLAVKTLIGSARLIKEDGRHPGILKNQVTSPAGTTIAGLIQLERAGVRGALIDAVMAACRRSREMSEHE